MRFGIIFFCLVFSSCLKKEPLRTLPPAGPEQRSQVDLGDNYTDVVYYDFETGNAQLRKLETWDLAFSSGDSGRGVILNGGKEIQGFKTLDTTFAAAYKAGLNSKWNFDHPSGWKDSLLFSHSWKEKFIYVLDLGKTRNVRYIKIRILSETESHWVFEWGKLDDVHSTIVKLNKNRNFNWVYFHFEQGVVAMEPPADQWDIVFTRYRHVYFDMIPVTPYYVIGALSNPMYTLNYEDSVNSFQNIHRQQFDEKLLNAKWDEIGYDWKMYNFTTERYSVFSHKNYLIKTREGNVYKMNFFDFYNTNGIKGSPGFVYQRL